MEIVKFILSIFEKLFKKVKESLPVQRFLAYRRLSALEKAKKIEEANEYCEAVRDWINNVIGIIIRIMIIALIVDFFVNGGSILQLLEELSKLSSLLN